MAKRQGKVDKRHAKVYRHLPGFGIASAVHIVAGGVGPERQRTAHRSVGFRHDAVRVFLNVGKETGLRTFGADQTGKVCCHFARAGEHELLVVGVGLRGQVAPKTLSEQALAVVAVAQANVAATVVGGGIAEHVKEETGDRIAFQRLGQNDHGLTTVVATVDASRVEAVIGYRVAASLAEKPLRVRIENLLARLAKVKPANHTNASRLRLTKHLAKRIPSCGEMRTAVVERYVGRIVGDDPAHSKQQDIGLEFGYLCRETRRIKGGVGLAQIRLHEPNRLAHPPSLLGVTKGTCEVED